MAGSAVEFELWSRQAWTNLEVVGEAYHLKDIRRLFPKQIGSTDRERVGTAHLRPEPSNRFDPNAVRVIVDGIHVGYLPKELAASYAPILSALISDGRAPVTPCRIWGYEYQDFDVDARGRQTRSVRFDAQARIALDEPNLVVPVNQPPSVPHRLLPRGNSLQLKEEQKHLDVLVPLVGSTGEVWTYGTLHALETGVGRPDKLLVEVRIDDEPIGVLTPAMGQHFLPVMNHLASQGETAAARVLLKGNALQVEATLYAARSHELGTAWLGESSARTTPYVQDSTLPTPDGLPTTEQPSAPMPGTSTASVNTVADLAAPVAIPARPSRIVFNPAPGWPAAPDDFVPPPGWQPLPDWPAPPADWPYWVTR